MKNAGLVLLLLAALAFAQQPGEVPPSPPPQEQARPPQPPAGVSLAATVPQAKVDRQDKVGPTDLNCAGFLRREVFDRTNQVAGGWNTPHTTKFEERDLIYLEGSGYQEGQMVSLVRELRDPNEYKLFPGQRKLVEQAGQPYADLGWARIIALRGKVAIARIEFACREVVPGDVAIPMAQRPPLTYLTRAAFDRFPQPSGKTKARIVMAQDFDASVGTRAKVYLNTGADQGVKPGDMFRVLRGYDPAEMDPGDAISFKATTTEDTQKNVFKPTASRMKDLPVRALGELVIVNVTPTSATGMITFALEDIHVGDSVEME